MREVIIDFEGCLQGGIREIGVIQTKNFEIADTWDITIKDKHDVTNALLTVFAEKPNYIVAHNAQIEKNLIREYLPYPKYEERGSLHSHWGPWLDTLTAYRTLYPSIKDYSLEKLTATFVEIKDLNALVKSYCQEKKGKAHFALYDAICTLMLVKRIAKLIDLASFIK